MNTISMETLELDFSAQSNEEICEWIMPELQRVRDDAMSALKLTEAANSGAWAIGKACDVISTRIGDENWLSFAGKTFGEENKWPTVRFMELARRDPEKPPVRGNAPSSAFKQLMIGFGEEMPPKPTPRVVDRHELKQFQACVDGLIRFWREGEKWMERPEDERQHILAEFKKLAAIAQKIEELEQAA
jgi:hypothetical protein